MRCSGTSEVPTQQTENKQTESSEAVASSTPLQGGFATHLVSQILTHIWKVLCLALSCSPRQNLWKHLEREGGRAKERENCITLESIKVSFCFL